MVLIHSLRVEFIFPKVRQKNHTALQVVDIIVL